MNPTILKPDLTIYFTAMPFIGMYLLHDYNSANTYSELLDVLHKWFNESERTVKVERKNIYSASAHYLYSFLTGKSFESSLNIN